LLGNVDTLARLGAGAAPASGGIPVHPADHLSESQSYCEFTTSRSQRKHEPAFFAAGTAWGTPLPLRIHTYHGINQPGNQLMGKFFSFWHAL
jgi:hypothetical protein